MATSKLALCPSCGKTVYFQGANNVVGCSCHKVWYRDGDVLAEADIRRIHDATDIIQPGTTGYWKGVRFAVTGRLRLWFDDSAYNYWTLDCPDGTVRYLAEGYGMYAVYEALQLNPAAVNRKFMIEPPANQLDLLEEGNYTISARNEAKMVELEGSVFVPAFPGIFRTIEATSEEGSVEIISYRKDFAIAYTVHAVSPESLLLENTREAELRGKAFSCYHCSTETQVSTFPYAQSWVCAGCNTRYSLENGDGQKFDHGYNVMSEPLFTFKRGEAIVVRGVSYIVMGVAFKQDKFSPDDTWREYTLYDKWHGFAFLTESQGHWTLLKETKGAANPLRIRDRDIRVQDRLYRRFSQYSYKILYAGGEFPGDIFKDHELVDVADYIAPPKLLSVEADAKHQVTWFVGEYIKSNEIQTELYHTLPDQVGIAPAQVKMKVEMDVIGKSGFIGVLLVLLVHLLTGGQSTSRTLLNASYPFADSLYSQTFVTEKFELEKWKGNVELAIQAPVENSWFELDATLVNADNGTEYGIERGVEYYRGYDSEGSWSEGSTQETAYFNGIPAGTYYLQLTGIRDYGSGMARYFSVRATYDTPIYRNLLIVLLLALLWPLGMAIADYNYEKQRWANSPFS